MFVLFFFLLSANILTYASPVRTIIGGPAIDKTPSPPRPKTAGKRLPSTFQHLYDEEVERIPTASSGHISTSPRRPARTASQVFELKRALAADTSDSSGHSSYHPTASETAESHLSYASDASDPRSSKRRKTLVRGETSSSVALQSKNLNVDSVLKSETTSVPKITIKVPNLTSTNKPSEQEKRKASAGLLSEAERIRRSRIYSKNHYLRSLGKPEEEIPLPPSWTSPEEKQKRREEAKRAIEGHTKRIDELIALRNQKASDYAKLSKEERSHPQVKQQHTKQQEEYQAEMSRVRSLRYRLIATQKMAEIRARWRLEKGLPLRGQGRPRKSDVMADQLKLSKASQKGSHDGSQIQSAAQLPLQEDLSTKLDSDSIPFEPHDRERATLGQIRWNVKKRGPRTRRTDFDTINMPVSPLSSDVRATASSLESSGIPLRHRRPRLPPSDDPWRERKRVKQRNLRAKLAGRPLEPLPPLPKRLKRGDVGWM